MGFFDFDPDLGLKLDQTNPKISGTVLVNRRTTIPNDYRQISACFDDDPKPLTCEIAQQSDRDGTIQKFDRTSGPDVRGPIMGRS